MSPKFESLDLIELKLLCHTKFLKAYPISVLSLSLKGQQILPQSACGLWDGGG